MAYNKEVQSRYKKKITQYKVQYSLSDNDRKESDRLKVYLAETKQSANSYIKRLIKSDLDKKAYYIQIIQITYDHSYCIGL